MDEQPKALRERLAQADPAPCNHEWFRTGAMEPNEARCLHCGEWRIKGKPQPDPEPVAWINWNAATGERSVGFFQESELASEPLYTAPPRRKWQGLTDEEILEVLGLEGYDSLALGNARAIEDALREKNT